MGADGMGKTLIGIGLLLVIVGCILHFGGKFIPFGRLPGDISIEGERGGFYFPIVSCIVISVILNILGRIFR